MSDNGKYGGARPQGTAGLCRRVVSERVGSTGIRAVNRQSVLIRLGYASGGEDPTNESVSEHTEALDERARNHRFDFLPDHISEVFDRMTEDQPDALLEAADAVSGDLAVEGRL